MTAPTPDPLSLNLAGETTRLYDVNRGHYATYEKLHKAYAQAVSCQLTPFTAETLAAVASALRGVVAECRETIVNADATAPLVRAVPKAWRPGDAQPTS